MIFIDYLSIELSVFVKSPLHEFSVDKVRCLSYIATHYFAHLLPFDVRIITCNNNKNNNNSNVTESYIPYKVTAAVEPYIYRDIELVTTAVVFFTCGRRLVGLTRFC